jgi:hypothetical protein
LHTPEEPVTNGGLPGPLKQVPGSFRIFDNGLPHEIAALSYDGHCQPVMDSLPVPAGQDYAMRLHNAQMLGSVLKLNPHLGSYFPHGHFLIAEDFQDNEPLGIGQHTHHLGLQVDNQVVRFHIKFLKVAENKISILAYLRTIASIAKPGQAGKSGAAMGAGQKCAGRSTQLPVICGGRVAGVEMGFDACDKIYRNSLHMQGWI